MSAGAKSRELHGAGPAKAASKTAGGNKAGLRRAAPKAVSWREAEPSLAEVCRRHPDFPRLVALKIDVQRRGAAYTPSALAAVDPARHMTAVRSDYYDKEDLSPVSFSLRDGTLVFTEGVLAPSDREPYVVDAEGDRIFLTDQGQVLEEVFYWEKPQYYDQTTSSGRPMWQIVSARPQRLTIHPYQFCDFWKLRGQGCKFCVMASNFRAGRKAALLAVDDVVETVAEALKEPGRNVNIFLTGGTRLEGAEPLDAELACYLQILKPLTKLFGGRKFPSQLISTAFAPNQLRRLHEETGLTGWTADLEVLHPRLFEWICPGKARTVGYETWKARLAAAVEIFGRGRVNTGLVGGVEMAAPHGFADENEALASTLTEAENLLRQGVWVVSCVWRVLKGSVFAGQKAPSLEYYVRLAQGLDSLRRAYGLEADLDDWRRCGNHPDTDLARA
ncbi:MAG: radical SAM protein [Deltaproteobacteria bacterium]|nr:radical SAM protein [Deltaproteobacteria bacterium]